MRLDNVVKLDENITSFENDDYELTREMIERYERSKIKIAKGQIKYGDNRFCKNASIFDVAGNKITWGDIAADDVDEMKGVYYILSEYKSYWDFRKVLPSLELVMMNIDYIRKNAIARIVDGKIETNDNLIFLHFQ
jgi:hypothetical protein